MPNPNTRLQHEANSGVLYTGHGKDYITCHWHQPNVKGVDETYAFKCNGDLACCGAECCTPVPAGIPLWLLILLLLLLALLLLCLCLGILYYCLKFCKRRPPPPSKPVPPPPPPKHVASKDGRETVLRESSMLRDETTATDDADIADIDSLPDPSERRTKASRARQLELSKARQLELEREYELLREREEMAFRDRNRDLALASGYLTPPQSPPRLKVRHPSFTRLNPDWWRRESALSSSATTPNTESLLREPVPAADWPYPGEEDEGDDVADVVVTRTAERSRRRVAEKVFVPSPMEESYIAPPRAIPVRAHDESELGTEQKPLVAKVDPGEEQQAKFMYYRPFVPSPMEEVVLPPPDRPTASLHDISEISTPKMPQASHVRTEEKKQAEVIYNRPNTDKVAAY